MPGSVAHAVNNILQTLIPQLCLTILDCRKVLHLNLSQRLVQSFWLLSGHDFAISITGWNDKHKRRPADSYNCTL
jgi:hypothetical protein